MDEIMLLKMLNEIDSMTSAEYWNFFNESQRLPDFLSDKIDWDKVPATVPIDEIVMFKNIFFSNEYKNHFEDLTNNCYSESEDTICLQAA